MNDKLKEAIRTIFLAMVSMKTGEADFTLTSPSGSKVTVRVELIVSQQQEAGDAI